MFAIRERSQRCFSCPVSLVATGVYDNDQTDMKRFKND